MEMDWKKIAYHYEKSKQHKDYYKPPSSIHLGTIQTKVYPATQKQKVVDLLDEKAHLTSKLVKINFEILQNYLFEKESQLPEKEEYYIKKEELNSSDFEEFINSL
jgi:hypothetical protein